MAGLKLIICGLIVVMWFVPAVPNLVSPAAAHVIHGAALIGVLLVIASYNVLGESLSALLRELKRRRQA